MTHPFHKKEKKKEYELGMVMDSGIQFILINSPILPYVVHTLR